MNKSLGCVGNALISTESKDKICRRQNRRNIFLILSLEPQTCLFAQLTRPENPALNPFQLRGADDADGEEFVQLSLKLTQLISAIAFPSGRGGAWWWRRGWVG